MERPDHDRPGNHQRRPGPAGSAGFRPGKDGLRRRGRRHVDFVDPGVHFRRVQEGDRGQEAEPGGQEGGQEDREDGGQELVQAT